MTLLEMSFYGAILIILILALRPLVKRFLPKRTLVIMWWVALVRLLVPFEIPWRFSAYTAIERVYPASAMIVRDLPLSGMFSRIAPQGPSPVVPANAPVAADIAPPALAPAAPAPASEWLLPAIYILGLILTLGFFIYSYVRLNKMMKSARDVTIPGGYLLRRASRESAPYGFGLRRHIRVLSCGSISSPFTFGLIRPVIVIPEGLLSRDEADIRAVICHELIHIKRFDAPLKALVALCCCVHWFNPLCWIMAKAYARDTELACDAAVLRELGYERRAGYATTLISLQSRDWGLRTSGFSRLAIKERVVWIMKYRRFPLTATVLAAGLVILMAAAFATSPDEIARAVKAIVTTKPYPPNTYQLGWDSFHPMSIDVGNDGRILISGYTDGQNSKIGMLYTCDIEGDLDWDWLELSRDALDLDTYTLSDSYYIDAKFVDAQTIAVLRNIPNGGVDYAAMLINGDSEIMKADCLSRNEYGIYPVPGGLLINGKPDPTTVRVTRMDTKGEILWQMLLAEPIRFNGIMTSSGAHLAFGYRLAQETHMPAIVAFDDRGEILWRYESSTGGEFTHAIVTREGNIVLVGFDPDAFEGHARGIIASFDMSGREIFAGECFYQDEKGFSDAIFNSVIQTEAGYIACINNADALTVRLVAFDDNGVVVNEMDMDVSNVDLYDRGRIAKIEGLRLLKAKNETFLILHGWANYTNEIGKPAYITVLTRLPAASKSNEQGDVLYETL